ncbi:MAG: HigA family addiction module antidote protein [Candidatus Tectomicrobia bacterium]|uniref:HigA family addiction module antidote protein n=1 Tax=Tectimicrobiota bacterium TaxID=2528274 RepID=A0A932CN11_UNCTE|nr:HigA family addiction module antidote protein [Candidatus Tectomicrobia bacterium]
MVTTEKMPPVHPGEILLEEFLIPMGISQHKLARETGIPVTRINAIVRGERGITADTALRLGRFFGISPQTWLNLQNHYDLETQKEALGDRLEREVRPLASTR